MSVTTGDQLESARSQYRSPGKVVLVAMQGCRLCCSSLNERRGGFGWKKTASV
jgi:hypothetical protein